MQKNLPLTAPPSLMMLQIYLTRGSSPLNFGPHSFLVIVSHVESHLTSCLAALTLLLLANAANFSHFGDEGKEEIVDLTEKGYGFSYFR